jgi:hypothetical protein
MPSSLTTANLRAGIAYWRTEKPNWPQDFHNSFYRELADLRRAGLTETWWEAMVHILRAWQASRGKTDAFIRQHGRERLGQLQTEYAQIVRAAGAHIPDIEGAQWNTVSGLYACASSIKGVGSPVFGSKLCHFILPNVYPVIDGAVMGGYGADYANYWLSCRMQWLASPDKAALRTTLAAAIGGDVVEHYPWTTKIPELCTIGGRHPSPSPPPP